MDMDSPENQSLKMVMAKSAESTNRQKSTKKDQSKNRWLLQKGKLADGTKLSYNYKGEILKTGCTKGDKICCNCCKKKLSPSRFESHAGRTNTKQPYQNIFLEEGMSLDDYSSYLKRNGEKRVEKNALLCMVCQTSGDLLSCENCPGSFHKECVSDTMTALNKRLCKQCQLTFIPEPNEKVSEVGPCKCDKLRGLWTCERCTSTCCKDTWKGFCTCPSCIGLCSCESLLGVCVCERWKDPWNCYEMGFDYSFSEFNLFN